MPCIFEKDLTQEIPLQHLVLYERNLEHSNKINCCYIDYTKAFDHVGWVLIEIIQNVGVD